MVRLSHPRTRAEGLDPHSVPMRWVERDPSGPLYDLLADPIGGDSLGGARKPQRWSKAQDDDVPEWARDDVAPSAAGGAHATATSPTSWRKKAEADKQTEQDSVSAAASAAPDDEEQVLNAQHESF